MQQHMHAENTWRDMRILPMPAIKDRRSSGCKMNKWQPIETSPKDGTDILVMTGETMHVVRWINIHGDFDYWAVDDNKHGPFTLRGKAPTHWMPLPEPAL